VPLLHVAHDAVPGVEVVNIGTWRSGKH
jgi:hypothetical protein